MNVDPTNRELINLQYYTFPCILLLQYCISCPFFVDPEAFAKTKGLIDAYSGFLNSVAESSSDLHLQWENPMLMVFNGNMI